MTRQMADDEVLLPPLPKAAGQLWMDVAGFSASTVGYSELQMREYARAAVAALQAERDALREKVARDHQWITDLLAENKAATERAESALEALRGQVAGLVAACEELDAAERAWDDAPGSVQGLGDTDGRDCDGPEYQRLVRAISARDAVLLAIKERMG